jgi:NAD(P)-dependent dehydrogenase (short-subunit alcohol dehydrogenase family)
MARIFITGSSDGLGQLAARLLVADDHQVVLHARDRQRAEVARAGVPGAQEVIVGDLSSIEQTKEIARQVNSLGRFDAVIHNAGVGFREPVRLLTADGLSHVFAVNTLAPYILTALIERPRRLVYLSSGMHQGGDASLEDVNWERRPWDGARAYADSKLQDVILAFAIARKWPDVYANALEPGWVPTKMGGHNAPDDLRAGPLTQVWLAVSADAGARVSGQYFFHMRRRSPHPAVYDVEIQEKLLATCARLSGVALPV